MVGEYGPFFFGNPYSQSWWRLQSPGEQSFLPAWVDGEIRGIDPESNVMQLEGVRKGL